MRLFHFVADFLKREDGPTAVEYAVMLALVIAVCVSSIGAFGLTTNGLLTEAATATTSP